jgi:S-adenosylmethionine hydrolase
MTQYKANGIITLLTDFGYRDPFVGVMKGVILTRFPQAVIVDLTHCIDAQDIAQGSFWLEKSFGWFPPGTVHVAVVDPAVGTSRAAVVVEAGGHCFVGPDNGLLAPAADTAGEATVREIDMARLGIPKPGDTFHGRDVFAPVSSLLASGGTDPESVGPPRSGLIDSPLPRVQRTLTGVLGSVVAIDHFGNLITNLDENLLKTGRTVDVCIMGKSLPLRRTFAEAERGEWLALVGSFGTVELAVREGHAASVLGVRPGTPVELLMSRSASSMPPP